jgi:hypothetical protein
MDAPLNLQIWHLNRSFCHRVKVHASYRHFCLAFRNFLHRGGPANLDNWLRKSLLQWAMEIARQGAEAMRRPRRNHTAARGEILAKRADFDTRMAVATAPDTLAVSNRPYC